MHKISDSLQQENVRCRTIPQSKFIWQIVEPSRISCIEVKKLLARKTFTWRVEHEDGVIYNLRERTHGAHERCRQGRLLSARNFHQPVVCIWPPRFLLMLLYDVWQVQSDRGAWQLRDPSNADRPGAYAYQRCV